MQCLPGYIIQNARSANKPAWMGCLRENKYYEH